MFQNINKTIKKALFQKTKITFLVHVFPLIVKSQSNDLKYLLLLHGGNEERIVIRGKQTPPERFKNINVAFVVLHLHQRILLFMCEKQS